MDPVSFEIIHGIAGLRVGRLVTPHGEIDTPAFFPLGTHGAVRGLTPQELRSVSVQGILANAYHLHLRPGEQIITRLGGLHAFMAWDGPILTDSGGYQVYSLNRCCERTEEGMYFRSPSDGSRVFLGPERCIAIQEALGADLIVSLDEFEPIAGTLDEAIRQRIRGQMERTLRWAARCRRAHQRHDQLLFGVVQGGACHDLRRESAERTAELGFQAFALGGFGLGEPVRLRSELVEVVITVLPATAPRYLMGVGAPLELVEAVARGVDLFDCVMPTRHGRRGWAFTRNGRLNLRNARFLEDQAPLEGDCSCLACASFSRAYLRHLITTRDMLGARLLSLHNIAFYMRLLAEMRTAIVQDRFEVWRREWRASYAGPTSDTSEDTGAKPGRLM